jgi:hypothetical protein
MTRFSSIAFVLLATVSGAVLVATTGAPAVAKEKKKEAAAPSGKLTKEAQKLLAETDKAMKAADFATAKTNLMAADALPTKNGYDSWIISQFLFDLGKKSKDDAMVNNAFERMAASEFLTKEYTPGTINLRTVTQSLFGIEYNKKNYPKAIYWGEQYLAANPADGDFMNELVKVALVTKDFNKAEGLAQKAIATKTAAGQKPTEFLYTALAEIYQGQKSPKFGPSLVELVKAYPNPRNWKFLLQDFQLRTRMTDKSAIDLYRLMYNTGVLDTQADVLDYAFTAFDGGLAIEAQKVIESNMASGKIGKGSAEAKDTLARAKTAQANDDPMPKQEARAAAAKTGDLDLFVGNAYLGGGNYAKAIDLIKRGLGKGLKDKNSANMKLGIAQLMNGDKVSAQATFANVAGDAKQTELAKHWSLYAATK